MDPLITLAVPKPVIQASMLGLVKLRHLAETALQCMSLPTGDLIELGVANGGGAALLAHIVKVTGSTKKVYLIDSWKGLPELSPKDTGIGKKGWFGNCTRENVENLLSSCELTEYCHIYEGWFEEVLPSLDINISLAHIDCDLYEPCDFALNYLSNRVVCNGAIVLDDYGSETGRNWPGVHSALHEFLDLHDSWKIGDVVGEIDGSVSITRLN